MLKNFLDKSGSASKVLIGLIMVTLLGLLDFYTSKEISFSIFYLLPISFVVWYVGKGYGILFAVLCAFVWFVVENLFTGPSFNEAIPYWNASVRLGFFLIVVLLIWKVKSLQENLEISVYQRTQELVSEITLHEQAKEEIILVNNQLRELNKKIETIREEQNTRIAREVHDELGQSLTAMNLELMWIIKKYSGSDDIVGRMMMLSGLVSDTINTVRKISSDLRPRLLDQLGIFPAIESQLKDFRNRTSVETLLSYPDDEIKIDTHVSSAIFRIFQEALTNISRHSRCSFVNVNLSVQDKQNLVMSIKDDGIGFDMKKNRNSMKGLGLLGMKERAGIHNGSLVINTSPGKGTEIVLKIPIQ
jgi:signal transduction histidine kinase